MSDQFTADEMTYHEKVVGGVLDAIVMAGAKEGEPGGMIDLPVAVDAMLASIATLAVQSGNLRRRAMPGYSPRHAARACTK